MKRIAALALAVLFVLLTLAACDTSGGDPAAASTMDPVYESVSVSVSMSSFVSASASSSYGASGSLSAANSAAQSSADAATQSSSSSSSSVAEPEPDPNADPILFDRNTSYYTIIFGTEEDELVKTAARRLDQTFVNHSLKWKTGSYGNDYQDREDAEPYVIAGKEILVGLTNRKESHDAYATLGTKEFVIKVDGDKIVIVGKDASSTVEAVEYFIKQFLAGGTKTELSLSRTYRYSGTLGAREIPLSGEASYRIMTYNLGASKCVPANVLAIINRHAPDIIGFQECNQNSTVKHWTNVINQLPTNYTYVTQKHSDGTYNYTPILYNKNKFTVLKSGLAWIKGRYTGTNSKAINWAVFQDKTTQKKFAVINFHGAVCNNSYTGFENYTSEQLAAQALTWRKQNVAHVLEIKDSILASYPNIPVMVTGDNNFNSDSEPYATLIAAGFRDAEKTASAGRVTGWKTSFTYGTVPVAGKSIDHIFGIGNVNFYVHSIIRGEDVYKASDHCPVYVDFSIS